MNKHPNSDNFIQGYYLDPSNCEGWIDYHNNLDATYQAPIVVKNDENIIVQVADVSKRNCFLNWVDYEEDILQSHFGNIWAFHEDYMRMHPIIDKSAGFGPRDSWELIKYEKGGHHIDWHYERMDNDGKSAGRLLTYITFLDDGCGSLEFMYQNKTFESEKGLTVIFPSDWTHTHRINPAPKGGMMVKGILTYYDSK